MRYAIVRDGLVENVATWDGESGWTPPKGTVAVPTADGVGPGWLLDGETFLPPPSDLTLDEQKALKISDATREFQIRQSAGLTYGGKTYQIDDASQARITSLAAMAGLAVIGVEGAAWPDPFGFIAADNTVVQFTAAEFVPFANAAADRVIALRSRVRALKDSIVVAADAEALDAIDVAADWP